MNDNYYEYTIRINPEVTDIISSKLEELAALSIYTVNPHEIETEIIPMLEEDKTNVFDDFSLLSDGGDSEHALIKAYFLQTQEDTVAVNLSADVGEVFLSDDARAFTIDNLPEGRLGPRELAERIVAEINFVLQFFEGLDFDISYKLIMGKEIEKYNSSHIEVFRLTDRIFVNPRDSEADIALEDGQELINIIPLSTYGSGKDETTSLAAKNLDEFLLGINDIGNISILDLGTGSGILAIVAAKLGVKNIKAIDIDKESVKIAEETAKLNQVSEYIEFALEELNQQGKFDLIVANLSSELIISLANELPKHLNPNAYMILSGINEKHLEEVLSSFDKAEFEIIRKSELNHWLTLLLSYKT